MSKQRVTHGHFDVFVYGSLLSGLHYHQQLSGARTIGEDWTEARFTMLDLGPYPGVLEGGETAIRGEIYRVDAVHLARLDSFERVPELYRRISTRLQSGRVVDMYALSGPRSDEEFLRVEGGDWRAWLALRKADSS